MNRAKVLLLVVLGLFLTTIVESQAAGMSEVWVAIRDDGKLGAGTLFDPFSGGTVEKLNGLQPRPEDPPSGDRVHCVKGEPGQVPGAG